MDHDGHNDHINVWAADSGADHGSGPRDSWEGCVQHNDFLPGTCSRGSASDQKCGIRTCKKKLKQIEKNEVGSYLEEAESFYKRVEERRRKSHEKKN